MAGPDFSALGVPVEEEAAPDFLALSEEKSTSALRRVVADPQLSIAKGIIGVPEAAVGLADLVSGGRAGKSLEEDFGFRPKDAKAFLDEFLSPAQKETNQTLANTKQTPNGAL
mgnify:CR=1 FL=1